MQTRIKILREQRHLTQKAVADYLGVTAAAYCNYEKGYRDISLDMLVKLSDFFDVNINELIVGDKNSEDPYSRSVANSEHLSRTFDVAIAGNISQAAYDEIMSYVDYIKIKYGYPKE